jgi:hypothetical protein
VIALLAAISWLTIANHCAFGGAMAAAAHRPAREIVGHGCCAGGATKEPGPLKNSDLPCCKVLRVIFVIPGKAAEVTAFQVGRLASYLLETHFAIHGSSSLPSRILETGPPEEITFAEAVLQHSLFAHAPPFLG